MASKGAIVLGFWFIDDGFRSKLCHGRSIEEVKDAKSLVVGQKLGIDTGRTKEIGGDIRLHKELAPETGGKLAVTARKDSGEVVLERANCTLR